MADFFHQALPWVAHVLLVVFAVAGVVGSLFPAFPGASLIWVGAVLHGLMTGWDPLGLGSQVTLGVLTGVAFGGQYLVTALGAKRFGSSGWGVLGAGIGLMVGTFAIPIPLIGSLLGAFAGAVAAELVVLRRQQGGAEDDLRLPHADAAADDEEPDREPPTKETGVRQHSAEAARAGMGAVLGAVVGLAFEFGTALVMVAVVLVAFLR